MATPRRSVPLALKIATLPPLAMGSPLDEKAQLPCIMITPSSPTHEYDYEFIIPRPDPKQSSFLSSLRQAFTGSRPPPYIALPDSPNPNWQSQQTRVGWSISKRFRAVLLLGACLLFIMFHLCVLPKVDNGLYDVLTTESHSEAGEALWEVVSGNVGAVPVPAADPATLAGRGFDADDTLAGAML